MLKLVAPSTWHALLATLQWLTGEIEHANVEAANVGDKIGIQVAEHAREHDKVFRVLPD